MNFFHQRKDFEEEKEGFWKAEMGSLVLGLISSCTHV
jgi:hypothetical protein